MYAVCIWQSLKKYPKVFILKLSSEPSFGNVEKNFFKFPVKQYRNSVRFLPLKISKLFGKKAPCHHLLIFASKMHLDLEAHLDLNHYT